MYMLSQEHAARIMRVVQRSPWSAAWRYAKQRGIQDARELDLLGLPAIVALMRQVESEWLTAPDDLERFKAWVEDIIALKSVLPARVSLVQPHDRQFRNLCGKLVVYGPARVQEVNNYRLWKFLYVTAIVAVSATSLTVVYGEGIQEELPYTSCRLWLDTDLPLLRSASADELAAMVLAAERTPEDDEGDDPRVLAVFVAQLLAHAL